ncbi:MAG: FAD binding domain-containing protein [Alphaproteobacteria bacterium]|nr:FAD binding domain-containing protein [Alphaproteobacteria bacterium]
MKPVPFEYEKPGSLSLAVSQLSATGVNGKIIAGGQSLGPMLNLRLARPEALIDIRQLDELSRVQSDEKTVTYGAAIRHVDFEDGLVEDATQGMMRHVAGGIAHRAVRNRGTIGGSLAHADPAADWVNTTIALNATFTVLGSTGRRTIAAADFFLGAFTTSLNDGEILEKITIPRLSDQAAWGYYKICRKKGEFAEAIGILVVDPARGFARAVLGAADAPPIVLDQLAASIAESGTAKDINLEEAVQAALPDASPVSLRHHSVALQRAIQQVYPS